MLLTRNYPLKCTYNISNFSYLFNIGNIVFQFVRIWVLLLLLYLDLLMLLLKIISLIFIFIQHFVLNNSLKLDSNIEKYWNSIGYLIIFVSKVGTNEECNYKCIFLFYLTCLCWSETSVNNIFIGVVFLNVCLPTVIGNENNHRLCQLVDIVKSTHSAREGQYTQSNVSSFSSDQYTINLQQPRGYDDPRNQFYK